MVPTARIAVGDVLDGKYEITGVLGEGAMGMVYEALHRRLQRKVALKTLQAGFAENAEFVARFEREARAASAIGHPNIVQVFDAGDQPVPYLVMEQLEGQSLGELLSSEGPLPLQRASDLVCQCLMGLGAAHRAGIIHRDLKPDNLFVTTNDSRGKTPGGELVKILDFGISKINSASEEGADSLSTRTGVVMGTPYYMSPEQASGDGQIDLRTDLWAMACVLYECLAGQPPFRGDNHTQTMSAVILGKYVSLAERCPDIPLDVSSIIDRALQHDPNKRYPDAESMAAALEAAVASAEASAGGGLTGFENLADRFLAQEAEEQEGSDWLSAPSDAIRNLGQSEPSADPIPELTPAPPPSSGPRDHRFGPPAAEGAMSLALDVDVPDVRRRTPPPDASTGTTPSSASRKRRKSQWVTREEPSTFGATLLKLFVVVLVVAGAGIGYRYYSLGYILPKDEPPIATLRVRVIPSDAEFALDQERQDATTVDLEIGREHLVGLRADGYLRARGTVTAQAGEAWVVVTQLGHRVPPIAADAIADPTGRTIKFRTMSPADVRSGYEKVRELSDCGVRLSAALETALATSPQEPQEQVPYNLTDECSVKVDVFTGKQPEMKELDQVSEALLVRIREFNDAVRDAKAAAGAGKKAQKEAWEDARRATAEARKIRARWLETMNQTVVHWLATDAERVRGTDAESMEAPLRDLIVASDIWVRAHLAKAKSAPELHEALEAAYKRAQGDARERSRQYDISGATAFLRSMKPLVEFEPTDELILFHNQAVEHFNRIILPLEPTR